MRTPFHNLPLYPCLSEHLVQCEDPGAIPSESLAAAILDTARQRVPDGVKASLLTELCDALSSPGPPRPEPPSAS